jgi:hypothetical protein
LDAHLDCSNSFEHDDLANRKRERRRNWVTESGAVARKIDVKGDKSISPSIWGQTAKQCAGTRLGAVSVAVIYRAVLRKGRVPQQLACKVRNDPVGSYGPANAIWPTQPINAVVRRPRFLTPIPAAPLLSRASWQPSYSQPFRPSLRRLWSTKLHDRPTTLAASSLQTPLSRGDRNHDPEGQPRQRPALGGLAALLMISTSVASAVGL